MVPMKLASVIDGAETDSSLAVEYASRNPSRSDEVVATVRLAGPEVFRRAAESARRAQREWAEVPAPVRGRVIASLGRLVEANKQALAALVTREIGKPAGEALVRSRRSSTPATSSSARAGGCTARPCPRRCRTSSCSPSASRSGGRRDHRRQLPGRGAVLVPGARAAVRNAVVWKAGRVRSGQRAALAELAWRAGVPAGVLNLVFADGPATYDGLEQALASGVVDKVGFTGSSAVGARIGELCGRHLQSPCLELGGKNPMVVTPDAELDLAVEGALFSGYGTAGQRCTSLGSVIVHADVHDEFVRRFDAAARAARIGDPTQDVLYGPLLDEKFADGFEKVLGWITDHHGRWARRRSVGSPPRRLGTASWVTRRPGCTTTRWCWTGCDPATRCSSRRPSARSSG